MSLSSIDAGSEQHYVIDQLISTKMILTVFFSSCVQKTIYQEPISICIVGNNNNSGFCAFTIWEPFYKTKGWKSCPLLSLGLSAELQLDFLHLNRLRSQYFFHIFGEQNNFCRKQQTFLLSVGPWPILVSLSAFSTGLAPSLTTTLSDPHILLNYVRQSGFWCLT